MAFKHDILNTMSLGGKIRVIPEDPLPVEEIVANIKTDGRKAYEDFQKLFFNYRNPSSLDKTALELFVDAITDGYLDIRAEFISLKPDIDVVVKDIGEGRIVESGTHIKWMNMCTIEFKRNPCYRCMSLLGYQD